MIQNLHNVDHSISNYFRTEEILIGGISYLLKNMQRNYIRQRHIIYIFSNVFSFFVVVNPKLRMICEDV